jgi:nitrate reductase NapAB chaperone NapD
MAICSYLVMPEPGQADALRERLASLPGCEVTPAENADLLLLVTEAADRAADEALRGRLEALDGIQAMVLTFGEVEAA